MAVNERSTLYAMVKERYPRFVEYVESSGGQIPAFVRKEFETDLECGLLEQRFLSAKFDECRHQHMVAFSCKRRGFCPSCGARRMVESAWHLIDPVQA